MNFYEETELRLLMQTLLWHFLTRIFNHLSSILSEGRDRVFILSIFFSSLFSFSLSFSFLLFKDIFPDTKNQFLKSILNMFTQWKTKQTLNRKLFRTSYHTEVRKDFILPRMVKFVSMLFQCSLSKNIRKHNEQYYLLH